MYLAKYSLEKREGGREASLGKAGRKMNNQRLRGCKKPWLKFDRMYKLRKAAVGVRGQSTQFYTLLKGLQGAPAYWFATTHNDTEVIE